MRRPIRWGFVLFWGLFFGALLTATPVAAQSISGLSPEAQVGIIILGIVGNFMSASVTAALQVLGHLKKPDGLTKEEAKDQYQKVKELHRWHSRFDEDGIPTWVITKPMRGVWEKQTELQERQVDLLEGLGEVLKRTCPKVKDP